jgi:peptidyl-prolyl cis-trans isomerase D
MAAISAIRKHGVLLMVIIGFALLLFLLTGLFDNNTLYRMFSSEKFTMGEVDGENVDKQYRELFEQNTALLKILNNKSTFEEAETYQIHQLSWQQLVDEKVLDKQLQALGIYYTDEMVENLINDAKASLRTERPNQYLGAFFQYLAQITGAENAQNIINSIEDYKNKEGAEEIYTAYKAIERRIVYEQKMNVYFSFSQGAVNFSDAIAQKLNSDNQTAMTQLLTVNPNAPVFKNLVINVDENEVEKWYEEHDYRYKIKENSRDLDIAIFPIAPTAKDKQNIADSVNVLYQQFVSAPAIDSFNLRQYFSLVDSTYHKKGDQVVVNGKNGYLALTVDALDTIIYNTPVGVNIAPYNYQDMMWLFGKSFGSAKRPDSLLVAFLVVDFKSSQNPKSTRTAEQAKLEADSLQNLLNNRQASVFSLLPNYLAGRSASDTTTWYEEKSTNKTLYDKLLKTPNGGYYVDELQSAYVIYQLLTRTQPLEKRQYALYSFDIKASDSTINNIKSNATQLAAASTSADGLVDEANKKGVQLLKGIDVTSMAATINQLTNCRLVVSWAYSDDIKENAISDVIKLDDRMFVVATLRNIKEKGIPDFEDVKDVVTNDYKAIKRVEKVEEMVKGEVAKGSSFAALASKYGTTVSDSVQLTFTGETYQNAGVENGAIGKIFTLPADRKMQVVSGKNMVYVVAVSSYQKVKPSAKFITEKGILKNMLLGRNRNEMVIIDGLKDNIDIWDNRGRFYAN